MLDEIAAGADLDTFMAMLVRGGRARWESVMA